VRENAVGNDAVPISVLRGGDNAVYRVPSSFMFLFSSLLPVLGRLYECNQYYLWLQDVLLPKML